MKGNFYALRRLLFSSTAYFLPRFILVTALFFSFMYVSAKTVVIGSGSGNVSQTSMSGLNPGDILAITPGTYSGGNFSNLTNITIINNGGLVTFTGYIVVGGDVGVTFSGTGNSSLTYGFALKGSGFNVTSRCQGMRFYNIYANKTGRFLDVSENQTTVLYNGTANSIRLQNATIANVRMINCGNMICGSFGHAYNMANVVDSIAAFNIVYDSVPGIGQVVSGGNIYRFDFHNMTINLPSTVHTGGDIGVFSINGGNGQLHNIYRNGGWGWLIRIFGASLGTAGDVWVYDNIDLNGTCYGTAEVRSDGIEWANTNNLLTGVNIHIINNTGGNKIDNFGTYNTAVALIPNVVAGYTAEVRNNLGFNNQNPGRAGGGVEFWQPNNPPTMSNNLYFNDYNAAGLTDAVNCNLKANSPAVDKGMSVARVSKDYADVPRPQGNAYDVGAREYNQNTPPPTNQLPVALAGANKTITLPTNSIGLDGSASSDPDGTIATYSWAQISGPSTSAVANGNTAKPTVSNLQAGAYVYELTVTDNKGATAKAQVTVTVSAAAPNQLPVANAGAAKTITLPTNSIGLDGSASSDPDGTIATYSWAQISGPSGSTITNANSAKPTASNLQAGAYVYELTVTDNKGATAKAQVTITVSAIAVPNQPPTANAGAAKTITLPTNTTGLDGSASSDPDGTIASYDWTQTAGPTTATVTNATTATPTVSNLQAGTYTYELTVTDNSGVTSKAQVSVTVSSPAPNQLPVANAGSDQTITLPTNSVSLNGTASSDPDGTIASYAWSQVSGPGSTINNATAGSTLATGLTAGTYVFKLVVTDNSGATATANVTVVVNQPANEIPSANAGADQTITLPKNSVNVDGSGSADPDGTISSYAWTQKSGPSTATIANAANVSTSITALVQGTYVFTLVVTDNNNATASDIVTITVLPAANQAPVANAGASKSITLPVNSVNLDGSASSDPDGTIATYSWAQITGPGTSTITGGNTATPTAGNLLAGQYTFELTVTDNKGATAKAQVKITVISAGSLPPVANAGNDQTIQLPTNGLNLIGSASQAPAGSITKYAWTQTSGPAGATIVNPTSVTSPVNNMTSGTYVFTLVITDNTNATASDFVTITVLPAANQAPVANAGASKTITLPVNSVSFSGTASSDADGTIASYSWAQVAGPTTASLVNGNTATVTANGLQAGQYTFELTVTDNDGATAKAQVKVTVLAAANKAPVANAGGDRAMTLPTNSIALNGTASSDPDGSIASYAWIKISGPAAITISNATTATPTLTGLQAGAYIIELTVTDNKGATAKDQVTISVNAAATPPPATNQAPVANAGSDQSIAQPTNSVNLNAGNSYDPDGSIASYSWTQVSGPSTATMQNATSGTAIAHNLIVGVYIFEVTVTDNKGAASKDRVTVTVRAASTSGTPIPPASNQSPVANAGSDQTISLPSTSTTLDGTASVDPNGTITTYQWQEMSGPNTATMSSVSGATPEVSDLTIGEYTFQLTVTDNNGSTSTAVVKVKVVDNLRSTESILLYPNPAHDVVNVRLISDSLGTVKVNIYDMNGKLVHASEMEKLQNVVQKSIDVNRLASGMYTLQAVIGSNKILLSKLIKQ